MIEALQNETVRFRFLLKDVTLGGLSGESPTIVIRRKRDGLYLQSPPTSFGGAGTQHPMIEVDAASEPGLYVFDFDQSIDGELDEYTAYMANDNPPKSGSALEVLYVKPQCGFAPGSTRGVYLFIASAGSPLGIPGLLPDVSIRRVSDGKWLDSTLLDFAAVVTFHAMTEVDPSNQLGVYRFDFDQSVDGALRRYTAYFRESVNVIVEAEEVAFQGVAGIPIGGLAFAGITSLEDNGLGCMTAAGPVVASPYQPVRYKIFVARESQIVVAADLFVESYLVGEFKLPIALICLEADLITPLLPLTRYTVGMRVFDARGQEDDNEETLTVEVTASSRLRLSTGSLRNLSTLGGGA